MNNQKEIKKMRVGDLRPSQLLYTFGVGSIIELPNLSVMVMGLDFWHAKDDSVEINEPRLLDAVRKQLGDQVGKLRTPPVANESNGSNPFDDSVMIGVPVAPFPRWMLCQYCRLLAPIQSGLFKADLKPYKRDRSRFIHHNCHKSGPAPTAVPARFLVACEKGHLDDFPWVEYVHGGGIACNPSVLRMSTVGASGDVASILVECKSCGINRNMSHAYKEDSKWLPSCSGRMPHLKKHNDEECGCKPRPINLGASNSWFPITLSVLSIPVSIDKLDQLVEENWSKLEICENPRDVKMRRDLLKKVTEYSDDEIWAAIEKRRNEGGEDDDKTVNLRDPEWEVFSKPDPKLNSRDFKLREVKVPQGYESWIEKVVLCEKLREVRSLIGFTRISSPGDYSDVAEIPDKQRAPLSRKEPTWVPASEVRGEGIFIQFSEDAIQEWEKKVSDLDKEFFKAHIEWRSSRGLDPLHGYPGIRFVLIHSLAHALIQQFSMECGYTAASIRERIYSRSADSEGGAMAGMLLYTAAPDSEGTLGGLVGLGESEILARHLNQALESMQLCSSDPLCAEHRAGDAGHRGLTLHGAACHACLFLPETSCERGNKFLDRSALVSTLDRDDLAFFSNYVEALPREWIEAHTDTETTPKPEPLPETPEYVKLLEVADERASEFLMQWGGEKLPLPEIDYELFDGSRVLSAPVALAWTDKKIAVLYPEHIKDKEIFDAHGWSVYSLDQLMKSFDELQTKTS